MRLEPPRAAASCADPARPCDGCVAGGGAPWVTTGLAPQELWLQFPRRVVAHALSVECAGVALLRVLAGAQVLGEAALDDSPGRQSHVFRFAEPERLEALTLRIERAHGDFSVVHRVDVEGPAGGDSSFLTELAL